MLKGRLSSLLAMEHITDMDSVIAALALETTGTAR